MISIKLLILVLLAYIIGHVFYNIFLHPLRSYPGPLLCRATPLPRIICRFKGLSVYHAHSLHERYGHVVRVSPNELSYTSSGAWKDIYGHGNSGKPLPKDPLSNPAPPDMDPGLINVLDEDKHRRQRQIFTPAFSNRALQEQESLLLKHTDALMANLKRQYESGARTNIVDMFNFATFDIMGELAFGRPLGLLESSAYNPWVNLTFAAIKMLTYRIILGYYMPITTRIMPYLIPKSLQKKRNEHMKYSADQVNSRLEKKTDRPDIWMLVLRDYDGKKPQLSLSEMHSNAGIFMIAGTETTATALAGTIYNLLKHPDCMRRLKEEIRSSFHSKEEMTLETLPRLPYLTAVLDESMRVYPATPEGLARVVPASGAEICGRFVPAGSTVFIMHYPAFRSSRNFALADSFVPERWLPDRDPAFAKDDKKAFQPFSVGPRNCIGRNLAYHEMRLVLTNLLWHFDLQLCKESNDWTDQKTFAVWSKPPLMVKVSPVNGS